VYVSTNAVFSGKPGAHAEDEPPDPEQRTDGYRNYGLARRTGEIAALEQWQDAVVVRTANVDGRDAWGAYNPRLRSLLDPLRAGQPLPRFVDRFISPTLVDSVADALVEIASPDFALPPGRILHAAGCEPASDYDYGQRLARAINADPALVRPDHYTLAPGRPAPYDISLSTAYTQSLLKTRLLNLDEMLARMI
jgi:dTDP-4-dehydrorhamnose reductase